MDSTGTLILATATLLCSLLPITCMVHRLLKWLRLWSLHGSHTVIHGSGLCPILFHQKPRSTETLKEIKKKKELNVLFEFGRIGHVMPNTTNYFGLSWWEQKASKTCENVGTYLSCYNLICITLNISLQKIQLFPRASHSDLITVWFTTKEMAKILEKTFVKIWRQEFSQGRNSGQTELCEKLRTQAYFQFEEFKFPSTPISAPSYNFKCNLNLQK